MRALSLAMLLASGLMPARAVWAEGHGVTVSNTGSETIRRIEIGTSDNRLRSQLPPGAQARISYSTGCQADVRLGFESGRTEAFAGVDMCGDARVEAGKGLTGAALSGPASSGTVSSGPTSSGPTSSGLGPGQPNRPGSVPPATAVSAASPVKAPPPVVPPWTGKSITKRFGGLD